MEKIVPIEVATVDEWPIHSMNCSVPNCKSMLWPESTFSTYTLMEGSTALALEERDKVILWYLVRSQLTLIDKFVPNF
jgi:hypothetical protein